METEGPVVKKQKLNEEVSNSETPSDIQPSEEDNASKIASNDISVDRDSEKQSETSSSVRNTSTSDDMPSANSDSRSSMTNGSGQKLESIIGRLCSDKKATSFENDDEPVLCKADACTQTSPDFVKIVKCLVLQRMKQLEQSLIGGAVADSVLNGKLAELHRENKELHEKTRSLQEKVNVLIGMRRQEEGVPSLKERETMDQIALQAMSIDGSSSPIRRQSAVVSPYNVNGFQPEMNPEIINQLEANRSRKEPERQLLRAQGPPSTQIPSNIQQNSNQLSMSHPMSQPPPPRQGPQVKYVPHKMPVSQVSPGGAGSQYVHLGQGNLVMQRMQPQHPQQASSGDHNMRVAQQQQQQVVYTAPPIQVTGPRMSTLPPQPQQVKQHHSVQRAMLSPSNTGVRLAQSGIPAASSVRLQGPAGQTVHYVPQGVMAGGYVTQVQPNFSQDGHRIVPQNPSSRDYRGHAPAGRNPVHNPGDFRPRPNQIAPPPYQSMPSRSQVEVQTPPKLQVNITVSGNGIVLSWDFEADPPPNPPTIECYHLFASQDSPSPPTKRSDWKKIGVVRALPLPMACTLTQFVSGNSYHFAVLAVDVHGREGQMSNPCTVRLNK